MRYDYDYEYAFYALRPEYLTTGKKNPGNYRITGCFNTGDYFCDDADNKEELEYFLDRIGRNDTIVQNSVAIQNKLGQLVWTRELGFNDTIKHPAYMDRMTALQVNQW